MRQTFFDKIIILIVAVVIMIFFGLAGYTTYATQKALIEEKQNNLINEANLLAEQAIMSYMHGAVSLEFLTSRFDEYENELKTSIWYYSSEGKLVAVSNSQKHFNVPEYIKELDDTIDMKKSFTKTGNFYSRFEGTVISVGIPITEGNKQAGYLILHSDIKEIDEIQDNILSIMYLPFLVMIVFLASVLLLMSRVVLKPVAKINHAASEYAKGNFDVKTGVNRKDEIGDLARSLEYMADELSKLDEYRKEFIANISHDFRSPLTSIKGYLEAMIDGTIPEEMYEKYLKIVLSESKRLTKLTEGLLELNNFDTYGPILKKTRFDIAEVIKVAVNTFERRCTEKNIELRYDCLGKDTLVYADKMKMSQVINNLVDNAIKFTPEGGTIVVSTYNRHGKVFVSVKDNGTGIAKDKQNKVFERFYKTDSSRGKDKLGTGLGLSIVKEVVKAHGENIDLISTEGVGSEFIFSLSKEPDTADE